MAQHHIHSSEQNVSPAATEVKATCKIKTILRATTAALVILLIFGVGEVSAQSAPTKLKVVKASYNYSLAPQGGNTYGPWNMLDGNIATAWAVSLNDKRIYGGDGDCGPYWIWGPVFEVPCKKLSHIIIRNGYGKSASSYIYNSRASFINFEIEGNGNLGGFNANLKDDPAPQRFNAPLKEEWNNNIVTIQISFDSQRGIIRGSKWNDLCITEIEFWGWK